MRKREVDERQESTMAEPEAFPGGGEESEFKRFEDLARKLVNTPKPETGEKRRDES